MMNSITRTMLTSTMGFAWNLIKTGERIVAFADRWELHEGNEQRAGFVELSVWRTGAAIVSIGEGLERAVNRFALWLGYDDGEVSGMVAWPLLVEAQDI
jgi:hypothetical protein